MIQGGTHRGVLAVVDLIQGTGAIAEAVAEAEAVVRAEAGGLDFFFFKKEKCYKLLFC